MITLKKRILVALGCLIPLFVTAQPLSVLGGGQKAQECFMNAEMAARNLPGVGRSLLEACDYTLEYAKINLQDRAATLANRGIVHAAMNNYDLAMKDYEDAIAMRPLAPEFYINRGNAFFMMRDFSKALDDYEYSIELGIKQLHFAHYNMGMVYERLGNDVAAEREYQTAHEFDPEWALPENKLEIVRARLAEAAAKEQQE